MWCYFHVPIKGKCINYMKPSWAVSRVTGELKTSLLETCSVSIIMVNMGCKLIMYICLLANAMSSFYNGELGNRKAVVTATEDSALLSPTTAITGFILTDVQNIYV